MEEVLLEKYFKGIDSCIIALSGGFDSAIVAYLAKMYLGEKKVIAATCVDNHIFSYQIRNAIEIASKLNIKWIPFSIYSDINNTFNLNHSNKCYICKSGILKKLIDIKNEMGVQALLDGTKSQDLQEDRPGLVALKEYGVLSPMLDSSFDARFIIHAKKYYNYAKINFVSESCKATRIMEGEITHEKLDLVENLEDALREKYPQIRTRIYNDYIKIEFKNNKSLSDDEKKDILFVIKYLVNTKTVLFNNQ